MGVEIHLPKLKTSDVRDVHTSYTNMTVTVTNSEHTVIVFKIGY